MKQNAAFCQWFKIEATLGTRQEKGAKVSQTEALLRNFTSYVTFSYNFSNPLFKSLFCF
jgi:hypothetical protein